MLLKTPENYLENRLRYLDEFLSRKGELIKCILENNDYYIYYNSVGGEETEIENSELWGWTKNSEIKNAYLMVNDDLYINETELKWIKSNRVLWMVTNSLVDVYIGYRKKNSSKSIALNTIRYSPVDFFYHCGESVKYSEVIFFIDILTILEGKFEIQSYLSNLRVKTISHKQDNPNPFKFISGDDELEWLLKRLHKHLLTTEFDINDLCKNNITSIVTSYFDYVALRLDKSGVKLFLMETKKALSQKRFRDKVKDKKVLNTYISKKAKIRLKHLSKKHELNINEILEILILGDDKRSQSQRLIDALESTME